MGTEGIWIPLVLAAVGAGASVYNTQKTAKKQDNALAAQIESASQKGREADARTSDLISQNASSSPAGERDKALSQYIAALNAGSGSATGGLISQRGGVSDRFAADAKDAALGVTEYGANQAGLFSTIDSAKRQRDQEATNVGRATTDIGAINRRARAADFLLGMKTTAAGARNPYIDAAAQFASGAASAYSGGAGGGGSVGGVTRQTIPTDSSLFVSDVPMNSSLFYGGR